MAPKAQLPRAAAVPAQPEEAPSESSSDDGGVDVKVELEGAAHQNHSRYEAASAQPEGAHHRGNGGGRKARPARGMCAQLAVPLSGALAWCPADGGRASWALPAAECCIRMYLAGGTNQMQGQQLAELLRSRPSGDNALCCAGRRRWYARRARS